MPKLLLKNKFFRLSLVMAFLSIVLYLFGLCFVFREIDKAYNLYSNTESDFAKSKKFSLIKSIIQNNTADIDNLKNILVKKGDEVEFIKLIESEAKAANVEFDISSIDLESLAEDQFKENLKIKINFEGSWKNTMNFIDKMQKMPFGSQINNINLDANRNVWTGSINFIIFREK